MDDSRIVVVIDLEAWSLADSDCGGVVVIDLEVCDA
jgi:phage terminase large subunit-like protein